MRLPRLDLLLRRKRFVLSIGDEGAVLAAISGNKVVDAWFAGVDDAEAVESFRDIVAADKRATLMVLVDVLEQMYREDTMPKVGLFDRAKVIKRRLDLAFPNEPLRGAVPTRHRPVAAKGLSVLFTALPMTPNIQAWLDFAESLVNPIVGFCLLPLESLDLIESLAPPVDTAGKKHWRSMISLEATGGFRQIIEQGGNLVVTRLIQQPADQMAPDEVAGLIEREFRSTIGYVKRMGFIETDHLDLIIVASEAVREALATRTIACSTLTIHTPEEAGQRLGLERVVGGDGGHADLLHAAWFARKSKPRGFVNSALLEKRRQLRLATQRGALAAAAASLLVGGMMASTSLDLGNAQQALDQATAEQARLAARIAEGQSQLEALPVPLGRMKVVVRSFEEMSSRQTAPLALVRQVGHAIGHDARAVKLTITGLSPKSATGATMDEGTAADPTAATQPVGVEMDLVVRFPGLKHKPEATVEAAKELAERLKGEFLDYTVTVVRLPVAVLPGQTLEGGFSAEIKPDAEPPSAEYTIRKEAS